MTDIEFIKQMSDRLNWTTDKTDSVLKMLAKLVEKNLEEGNFVDIEGIGCFKTIKKDEYISIDSATKKRYLIPPKISVAFFSDKNVNVSPTKKE